MANNLRSFWKWFRESQTPRRPKASLEEPIYQPAAAVATGSSKAWYVFYIPKGREPKSFGGKTGWDWPKAYFGPYESRAAAVSAVQHEARASEEATARYKIRHVTPEEFAKLWGEPPASHFVPPWSSEG